MARRRTSSFKHGAHHISQFRPTKATTLDDFFTKRKVIDDTPEFDTTTLKLKKIKVPRLKKLKGKPVTEKQREQFKNLKQKHNKKTVETAKKLTRKYGKYLDVQQFKKANAELASQGIINKIERRSPSDFKDAEEMQRAIDYLKKQGTKKFANKRVKQLKDNFIEALPIPPLKGTLASAIKHAIQRMSADEFHQYILENKDATGEFWALYHALISRRNLTPHERGIANRLHLNEDDEINSTLMNLAFTLEDHGLSKKWTR